VSRSTRRLALALAAPFLLTALVACGDDTGDASSAGGLDTVTVEGEVGSAPEVTFDGQVEVSKIETETLITGDGEKVEDGDQVLTHLWIGNGYTQEEALNTYKDKKPELITVSDDIGEVFQAAIEGQTIGSRVLVAAPAADAFGEGGNPALGILRQASVQHCIRNGIANFIGMAFADRFGGEDEVFTHGSSGVHYEHIDVSR